MIASRSGLPAASVPRFVRGAAAGDCAVVGGGCAGVGCAARWTATHTSAVADAATRSLLYDPNNPNGPLFNLMSDMADFKNANGKGIGAQKIGDVENEWNTVIKNAATTGHTSDNSAFPPAAAAAIRVYNRYFELKTL